MDGDAHPYPVESLTEREYDVLRLLAAGHTNRRVAELLVLSIHTVKWHNRQIYGKLGVAGREEAVQVARAIGLLAAAESEAKPRHHLPAPPMPLLGRQAELDELRRLLTEGEARLVSIVAPGGMGKTHLALVAAQRLAEHFDDGAAFANLAPLPSVEGIVPALAQALDFRLAGESDDPQRQLLHHLREKSLLLVLDNFEHLQEGVSLLTEIVASAPRVRLLVTSRERLQLQAEQLFLLQGLRYAQWASLEEALQEPAVELFVAYGRRLRADFELQSRHLQPLRRILKLTEGMPLAIILAASWLELLSPAQIAVKLEQGLDILKGDYQDLPSRQRSMRAVFASTWERLDEKERAHFAALSVFRGGFTVRAAREVAGASPADLRHLLKRSLIVRGEGGRLEVHELLRQFAAEQLSRTPSLENAVRDAQSSYFLQRLGDHEAQLKGAGAEEALSQIESDFQNHQAAWLWAVEQGEFAAMLPAALSLATYCLQRGRFQEGLTMFNHAVQIARQRTSGSGEAERNALRLLVHALARKSDLLFAIGATSEAEVCSLEALSLLERSEFKGEDMRAEKALVYLCLSRIYEWLDRYQEATTFLEESIGYARSLGDRWHIAEAIMLMGGVAMRRGKYEAAIQRMNEAQELYYTLGDRRSETFAQMWQATIQTWWWPTEQAERTLQECLAFFRELGDPNAEAWSRQGLSQAYLQRGVFAEGRDLHLENVTLYERLGMAERLASEIAKAATGAMHQGNYGQALSEYRKATEIAADSEMPYLAAFLSLCAGSVLLAQEHVGEARQFLENSTTILRDIGQYDDLTGALAVLSCAFSAEGQFHEARQALAEALTWCIELRSFFVMHVLPAAGLFLTRTGRPLRALEIWERARQYPFVARSKWFADVAGKHIEAAATTLPPDEVRDARERGKTLDLWATVAQLQEEL